jgi:hypothetical protein
MDLIQSILDAAEEEQWGFLARQHKIPRHSIEICFHTYNPTEKTLLCNLCGGKEMKMDSGRTASGYKTKHCILPQHERQLEIAALVDPTPHAEITAAINQMKEADHEKFSHLVFLKAQPHCSCCAKTFALSNNNLQNNCKDHFGSSGHNKQKTKDAGSSAAVEAQAVRADGGSQTAGTLAAEKGAAGAEVQGEVVGAACGKEAAAGKQQKPKQQKLGFTVQSN